MPEQPDLNWANPLATDVFTTVVGYCCERCAHGFRLDIAHGLTRDPGLRDNPQLRPVEAGMHPMDGFDSFEHMHDLHRAETAWLSRSSATRCADTRPCSWAR